MDLDNVILDWQGGWIEQYEFWFDRKVGATDTGSWSGFLTGTHFGTADEFWHWMDVADVHAALKPIRGALGGLYELQHTDYELVFCTARPEGAAQHAARMFAYKQGIQIEFRTPSEKHLTKADVWIDDSPEVLANLRTNSKTAIRFAQPWNKPHQAPHSAYDWNDILTIVSELREEG